jgi:hypothetical protein
VPSPASWMITLVQCTYLIVYMLQAAWHTAY